MKLIIDIPEDIKATIDRYGTSEFVAEMLWEAVKNGTPLEEELVREKEQAYYIGYEDARKSQWTAVAESEEI